MNHPDKIRLGCHNTDGSPLYIDSSMAPLSIFGTYGSGKTVAAQGIFDQLAAHSSNDETVIAIDATSVAGYDAVARQHGGRCLVLTEDGGLAPPSDEDGQEDRVPGADSIVSVAASPLADPLHRPQSVEDLRNLLIGYLDTDKRTHLIVDPVDPLLAYEDLADVLHAAWRTARTTDSIAVAVFSELNAFQGLDGETKALLGALGSKLYIGETSVRLARTLDLPGRWHPLLAEVSKLSQMSTGGAVFCPTTGGITTLKVDPPRQSELEPA